MMGEVGEDIIQQRGIDRNMFCEACGYNLRTRPRLGRCPECGGEYDTRPVTMKGILFPQDTRFFLEIGGAVTRVLLCTLFAFLLFCYAVAKNAIWAYLFGTPFVVMAVLFLRVGFLRTAKLVRRRTLLREVHRQENETPS